MKGKKCCICDVIYLGQRLALQQSCGAAVAWLGGPETDVGESKRERDKDGKLKQVS